MTVDVAQLAHTVRDGIRLGADERLWGVVDGARDLELAYEAPIHFGHSILSLFHGAMAPALGDVAPYLVPIDPDSGYLENWARRLGSNAGILPATSVDLERLATHLREIFVVTDKGGQEFFFRFYDPRVLRAYLSTCTPQDLGALFGPLRALVVETASADGYASYAVGDGGLSTTSIASGDQSVPSTGRTS